MRYGNISLVCKPTLSHLLSVALGGRMMSQMDLSAEPARSFLCFHMCVYVCIYISKSYF